MSHTKKRILSFSLLFLFGIIRLTLVSIAPSVNAQQPLVDGQIIFQEIGGTAYGQSAQPQDIRVTVVRIINVILGLLAIIFLVLVVVAGIKYMMSGGNQDKAGEALKWIKNAVLGLIITVFSWSISFFILLRLRAITRGDVNYINPSENIF